MQLEVADSMVTNPCRIQRISRETHDTFTIELVAGKGKRPFPFTPGQFNMLYVYGVGEAAISISGDPAKPETLVHTTRAVGTVTKAMKKMKAGSSLGVRGPFGSAWPIAEAAGQDIVFVAGGIGLAPLRPALYYVLEHRQEYGKVVLLYGTRTPQDILYRKEIQRWRSQFDLDVYVTTDRATGDWHGNVGVVTNLVRRAPFDPMATTAFVCGPEIMMRFTVQELAKRGVDDNQIMISMERNMKCAIGFCGHCQWGSQFVCKDGPVFPYGHIKNLFNKWEV
jgi:NAD(P)H-flavin reductase